MCLQNASRATYSALPDLHRPAARLKARRRQPGHPHRHMTWFWLNIPLGATPGREVCTMLTGKWITADDGALVIQWNEQKRGLELEQTLEQEREEMKLAA